MTVLVTGGAGYIGSVLVEKLCDAEEDVIVVDDFSTGKYLAIDKRVRKWYESTLTNESSVGRIFSDNSVDAVVHLAAHANVPESISLPAFYYDNNVVGTYNLLEEMQSYGIKKLIFASTSAIDSDTPYGNSKLCCEKMIKDFSRAYGMLYYTFRFYCVAGATALCGESRKHETHLIPLVLDTALGRREEVCIYGDDFDTPDGTGIRDYIHVEDIVNAIMLGLRFDALPNLTMPLGTGVGYSVKQIIAKVENVTGVSIRSSLCPPREGDLPRLVDSSSLAYRELGWLPKKTLTDIIKSAYEWRKHPLY